MKHILYLFIIAVLICGLFGCSDASSTADEPTTAEQTTSESQTTEPTEAPSTEPPTTEPPTTQAPVTEPAEPTVYLYDELGFRLTFPAHWEGRYTVESSAESNSVTVSADGAPVLTLVAVPNAPGAYERSMELYADDYEFFNENFDYTYYIKLHGEFPEDLSWNDTGITGTDPAVLWDAMNLFSYQGENWNVTTPTEQGTVLRSWYNSVLTLPSEIQTYYNYRLGIKINIPEFLVGVKIAPTKYMICISQDELPPLETRSELARFYVYNSDLGHEEAIFPADQDPYPLLNEEWGYEANVLLENYGNRKYYVNIPQLANFTGDSHQHSLMPLRQQIFDNIDEIFSIIES